MNRNGSESVISSDEGELLYLLSRRLHTCCCYCCAHTDTCVYLYSARQKGDLARILRLLQVEENGKNISTFLHDAGPGTSRDIFMKWSPRVCQELAQDTGGRLCIPKHFCPNFWNALYTHKCCVANILFAGAPCVQRPCPCCCLPSLAHVEQDGCMSWMESASKWSIWRVSILLKSNVRLCRNSDGCATI